MTHALCILLQSRTLRTIAVLALLGPTASGCDDESGPGANVVADAGPEDAASLGDAAAEAATPDAAERTLAVSLNAGHSHIYKETKIGFRVVDKGRCTQQTTDAGTSVEVCPGVAGLTPVAFHQAAGVSVEQPLAPGTFVDLGDGTYQWTKTFTVLGTNVLGLRFPADGRTHFASFPFETSRGGGERYFCDPNGDRVEDFAFQVRWNPTGPAVKASGMATTFQLEIMRSTNAPPLNIAQPFRNSFEHLRPADLKDGRLQVRLMAGTGTAAAEVAALEAKYTGRGLYTVTKTFAPEELAGQPSRVFWIRVTFTDDKGCLVDTVDELEYQFALLP